MNSLYVVKNPAVSVSKYYCTEDEWREYTGFTDQVDFPSNEVITHLENATEQLKKDAFFMVRWELVTKDSEGRYFTARKFWANRYGVNTKETEIVHGTVTKYDLQPYEVDRVGSFSASLALYTSQINQILYPIPNGAVTEIDPLNCWFKLSSDYPTASRQVVVTYWVVGKPLDELSYELKMACMEKTTILALQKLKTKRLKLGTVSYTLGKQTVTRDETIFDAMVKQHIDEYDKWVRWFKAFIGRKARIGRAETFPKTRYINRY
jgi:hypothetical protein